MDSCESHLSAQDLRAWTALRLMSRQIDAQLARRLAGSSPLSMQDYDVLSSVASREDRRMLMKDLMYHLQWSYSRLSHHLGRMESRGLAQRVPADSTSGTDVLITNEGLASIKAATSDHLAAVKEHFADLLESGDAEVLDRLSQRILSHLPGPTPTRGW